MRVSKLSLVAKCPASYQMDRKVSNRFAVMGMAFHELMAYKILNKADSRAIQAKLDELGLRYGLSKNNKEDIKAGLYNVELNIPDGIKIHVEANIIKQIDEKNDTHALSGHMDLYYLQNQEEASLFDWKLGWGDVDPPQYNLQMIGYAVLILSAHPQLKKVNAYIVQPKLNKILNYSFSAEEIEKYRPIIIDIIKECSKPNPTPIIGEHCQWCSPMQCLAYTKEIQVFAEQLDKADFDKSIEINLAKLLPFVKSLSKVCKQVEDIAKAYIDENGSLPIGENRSYIKVLEERKGIDYILANPYLREKFGDNIDKIIKIGMTDLKKFCASTERGLSKTIINDLSDIGAIFTTHINKYKIIHNPIEIEEGNK